MVSVASGVGAGRSADGVGFRDMSASASITTASEVVTTSETSGRSAAAFAATTSATADTSGSRMAATALRCCGAMLNVCGGISGVSARAPQITKDAMPLEVSQKGE